jgi:N-hydroxyarylamine O-acetyltransferase
LNIEAYLQRISCQGFYAPTAQSLRDLQLAHLFAIPFENLSIHIGEPIVLEDDALFAKVVERQRGGFCYELNGLFSALLRSLGFNVTMLAARVADGEGGFTPDFDHMTLLVSLDEDWLIDVGFGDSFREPLVINDPNEQTQYGGAYRILSDGEHKILMEHKKGDEWKAQYRFKLHPYQYVDYTKRCQYHQTSPASHFTQRRVCSRATPGGRITLSETRFIATTLNGDRQEHVLSNEEEYEMILRKHFGIIL